MSIVVFGAGGLLGRHVVEALRGEVIARDRKSCDIGDPRAVAESVAGAEVVINCAAFTDVDGAERDPEGAFRANADGAEQVAQAAARVGARCLHVSTDFVFDGRRDRPYAEDDPPAPLSVYGRSKRAGEERALAAGASVVRVQALYGLGGRGFSSRMAELLRAGRSLKLDDERVVQPTFARVAARALARLAHEPTSGVYHVSCTGQTTWAGFARALAARLGLAARFEAVATAQLAAPAARPRWCVFSHGRAEAAGVVLPAWDTALDEYATELPA